MTSDERMRILNKIAQLDCLIVQASAHAARFSEDIEFEMVTRELRQMRARRSQLQAKLDAK